MFNKIIISLLAVVTLFAFTAINANPIDSATLFEQPRYRSLSITPDGSHLLMLKTNVDDTSISQLRLINISTNEVVDRTNLPKGTIVQNIWISDKLLYIGITFRRNQIDVTATSMQIYIDITGNSLAITKRSIPGYYLAKLGDKFLYAKRRKAGGVHSEYFDLYKATLEEIRSNDFKLRSKVDHKDNRLSYYIYNEQLDKVIGVKYNRKTNRTYVKQLTVRWAEWESLFSIKETKYAFKVIDLLDKNTLAVLTNKNTDKVVLQKYDLANKKFGDIIFQHPNYDLIDAGFNRNAKAAYVKYIDQGAIQVHYFEESTMALLNRFKKTLGDAVIYPIDKSNNGNLLLLVSASDNPGQYYIYDKSSDNLLKIVDRYPQLKNESFSKSQVLNVKTSDGQTIEAYLNVPTSINHNVLLVIPHGGPIGHRDYSHFDRSTQYLTSRGFSTLRVNFRGSSGFGEEFQNQGIGEFGKLIEQDIKLVLNNVLAEHSFDKLCTMGSSYGGYSAVILALKNPQMFNCVIASYGIYDLKLLFNASNIKATEAVREIISGVVGEYSEELSLTSPTNYVAEFNQPLLLIAGKKDQIADFEHTSRFHYLLEMYEKDVETMFYPDVGHGHKSIRGLSHELAMKYDYLMRTLNIENTHLDLLENGTEAIANDYMYLSNYYNDDGLLDSERKIHYSNIAAQLGNAKALYQLGLAYDIDGKKELNRDKAFTYYKKAADAGSHQAMNKLGTMYSEGDYVNQDWGQSRKYLYEAVKEKRTAKNLISFARFYCISPKEYRDINKCINYMSYHQFRDMNRSEQNIAVKMIKQTIASMIGIVDLTAKELKNLQSYIGSAFELPFRPFTVDDVEPGLYKQQDSTKFGSGDNYELVSAGTSHYKSSDDLELGIKFTTDLEGINFSSDKEIGLIARWYKLKAGKKEYLEKHFVFALSETDWQITREMSDIEPGEVYLEVYNINNQELLNIKFDIAP